MAPLLEPDPSQTRSTATPPSHHTAAKKSASIVYPCRTSPLCVYRPYCPSVSASGRSRRRRVVRHVSPTTVITGLMLDLVGRNGRYKFTSNVSAPTTTAREVVTYVWRVCSRDRTTSVDCQCPLDGHSRAVGPENEASVRECSVARKTLSMTRMGYKRLHSSATIRSP